MNMGAGFNIESVVEPLNLQEVAEEMLLMDVLKTRAPKVLKESFDKPFPSFQQKGDLIFLIGTAPEDISDSLYLKGFHKVSANTAAYFSAKEDAEFKDEVKRLLAANILQSYKEVGLGGLFFTLFEAAAKREFGFDITLPIEFRRDAYLFGEAKSRAVVTIHEKDHDRFLKLFDESAVPHILLGHVTKNELRIDDESYGFMDELKVQWIS